MADIRDAVGPLEEEADVFVVKAAVMYEEDGLVEAELEVEIVDEDHPRRESIDG